MFVAQFGTLVVRFVVVVVGGGGVAFNVCVPGIAHGGNFW